MSFLGMLKQSNRLSRTKNWNLLCHSSRMLEVQNQVVGRAMLSLKALRGIIPGLFLASGRRQQSLVFLGL